LAASFGANARYLLLAGRQTLWHSLSYGTFLINLSGSFILGLFAALMLKHPDSHYPRLFFAVGF
jgi:fluoride ion exporter CrcB/FEX